MKLSRLLIQTLCVVAFYVIGYGQCTYTTSGAGAYFSAGNWVNGLQPPNPIPYGVTVTLNHVMTVSGVIENNGTINGGILTILSTGGYGGKGTFTGTILNQGTISPGSYAPATIVNNLAGITTVAASGITTSGAISGGEICHDGGSPVTARGVCYGTSPNPDITGPKTTDGAGTGVFVSTLTGLAPGTPYYVRAYATNGVGTSYGQEVNFITSASGWTCGDPLVYGGKSYTTQLMPDGKCWMTQNLDIGTMITGTTEQSNNAVIEKYCYDNNAANCITYGGLYQWAEAVQYQNGATNNLSPSPAFSGNVQGVCPTGWHLPSDGDWIDLADALPAPDKGSRLAGNEPLWLDGFQDMSPVFGTSGFMGLPGGRRFTDGSYQNLSEYAIFWTSTELSSNDALFYYLFYDYVDITQNFDGKAYGFSVRCVKD